MVTSDILILHCESGLACTNAMSFRPKMRSLKSGSKHATAMNYAY